MEFTFSQENHIFLESATDSFNLIAIKEIHDQRHKQTKIYFIFIIKSFYDSRDKGTDERK